MLADKMNQQMDNHHLMPSHPHPQEGETDCLKEAQYHNQKKKTFVMSHNIQPAHRAQHLLYTPIYTYGRLYWSRTNHKLRT